LLAAAEGWLRERGMETVRGPLSFSINQEVGLLIKGFDTPPMIMMNHARPYYGRLIESAGFSKAMDLSAFTYNLEAVPPKAHRAVETLRQRPDITIRSGDIHRFNEEIGIILDVFNSAWSDNWGFVPVTPAEAHHMAKELRQIVDPDMAVIVEMDGKPAGVVMVTPDFNEAIRDLNGRLLPFGWAKLLWRLKVRPLKSGRPMILGGKKEYSTR